MKKVSIIVPVYNVEKYLSKCLDSLVNQTLKDIEIIVVNDGSPDNSQSIIDDYVKKYPKLIKSIIKENGGQGSARNVGFDVSSGEYIMYVDSDDTIELNMAQIMYNEAKKENNDVVVCGTNIINEDYKIIKQESSKLSNNNTINILFGKMAVWNKIYKKEYLVKLNCNFRSKVWYEDLDFSTKVLLSTDNIKYIDDCLYNYLLREGSTMNNSNVYRNLELCDAFDEIIKYFKNNKIYKVNKNKIEMICIYHMYICAIVRIINMNCSYKNKLSVIKKFKKYIYINFPEFKKNLYIKNLSMNKKIIYYLVKYRLYFIIKIIFKMKGSIT